MGLEISRRWWEAGRQTRQGQGKEAWGESRETQDSKVAHRQLCLEPTLSAHNITRWVKETPGKRTLSSLDWSVVSRLRTTS